ncbi:9165_t:CDS:2 [Dentiscutata erythropus]|uniref:9165_t:CDS:1 n=1 Tax=Dentiscutata erythropus TaxID=1348616 RepID=A0A9N9J9Z9_9GLOM|nr:9165_t:CDS:2 [Dentiscutata erythropus]
MPASVTVLCYVTNYRKSFANKDLTIVEASGIVRSRSMNSPLNVILIRFYPNNVIQELSLPEFENEDVILATGNFRIIENVDKDNKKYPILKVIVLNDIIRFNDIDPNNIPAFPILLNMTAVAQEEPVIDEEDVTIKVSSRNFIDQDYANIEMMCYYSVYARHLMNIITTVKKHSVIYINGELIITDDSNLVHIRSISFPEYQNSILATRDTIQLSWETKNNDEENKLNTVAQTIATKVKGNSRRKKITPTTTPYFKTKPRFIRPKVTDLANNFLNQKSNTPEQTTSSATNAK